MADETTAAKKTGITVKSLVNGDKIAEDLRVNITDLSNEMAQQSSHFAFYSHQMAYAEKQVADLKLILEVQEGRIDAELRDAAAEAGEKTTEAGLAKKVALDPRVIQLKKAINEAALIASLAKSACEGLRQKKDMLVQMGATEREELKGDLRMKALEASNNAADAVRRDLRARALATVGAS